MEPEGKRVFGTEKPKFTLTTAVVDTQTQLNHYIEKSTIPGLKDATYRFVGELPPV